MEQLLADILKFIEKHPYDKSAYRDYLSAAKGLDTHDGGQEFRKLCRYANQTCTTVSDSREFYTLWERSLCYDAEADFDSYLMYVEHRKAPEKQFYSPRRRYLYPVVQAYQAVEDGQVDLLVVELIKRAGKSQLGINFCDWISGKRPNKSILMEGTGDDLVKSFYNGCLEYLQQPSDYAYYDVFPDSPLVQTNADTKIINLRDKSRFPTIMCRSIDARQVGLSEATNLLYLDDCVEGRLEAQNRLLLDRKWEVISGDVLGRKIEGTPIVVCGTRYSLYDPISHLIDAGLERGWRVKEIKVPALDPITDESNYEFELDGKKIFTTQFFRDQRDILSAEQWESEFQQEPFEAKGLVLPPAELNYYYELPQDYEPDYIMAVGDTAEGGGDSVAVPIGAIYGNDVYIIDVVFDNSPPDVTKPLCAQKLIDNKVGSSVWESNSAGAYYARDVEELVKKKGGKCGFRTKRTISNKATRIELASDNIKRNFYFKDPSMYAKNSQYGLFMKEATSYTRSGKNAHDDAIDALSLFENELRATGSTIELVRRFF